MGGVDVQGGGADSITAATAAAVGSSDSRRTLLLLLFGVLQPLVLTGLHRGHCVPAAGETTAGAYIAWDMANNGRIKLLP